METELVAPVHIDFNEGVEDDERERLPVYLRIKPQDDEESSIKILSSTTVETNHGQGFLLVDVKSARRNSILPVVFTNGSCSSQLSERTRKQPIHTSFLGVQLSKTCSMAPQHS